MYLLEFMYVYWLRLSWLIGIIRQQNLSLAISYLQWLNWRSCSECAWPGSFQYRISHESLPSDKGCFEFVFDDWCITEPQWSALCVKSFLFSFHFTYLSLGLVSFHRWVHARDKAGRVLFAVSEMASLFGTPVLVFFRFFFEDAALGLLLKIMEPGGPSAGGRASESSEFFPKSQNLLATLTFERREICRSGQCPYRAN